MYGAILGDMIGAPYEFDRSHKTKKFPLFGKGSHFTDDSVMTVAVAEALLDSMGKSDDEIRHTLVESMQKWGKKYPNAGYGCMFYKWLREKKPQPYGSYGNGSAMRVSAAGWLYDSIERTRKVARLTAEVTHNHPEGIKGAEATASAIFMARTGSTKDEIRDYITREFGYDLSRTCDEIRPGYHHVETCQQTVPEAITAFLEGEDFEDVIRTAVSLGGDCDTLTCIAGGIAEAYYGIPDKIVKECRKRLPEDMLEVIDRFTEMKQDTENPPFHDIFLDGNDIIDDAINKYRDERSEENLSALLEAIRERMHQDGHFIVPVIKDEEDENSFALRILHTKDGKIWHAAFTSKEEFEKGAPSEVLSNYIDVMLKANQESEASGIIINPWGQAFLLANELIERIIEADGGVEYSVPDVQITAELLEDGSFLKKAIEICNRNRTKFNLIKLVKIIRDSLVWIPCTAVLSDRDYENWSKVVLEAADKNDLDSVVGHVFTNEDNIRFVPDILQNGNDYFFPVFTSDDEMGEYGEHFSKLQKHFLEAANLARNNEKNVKGIIINAFSESFFIPVEMFDLIADMESSLEENEEQK